MRLLKLLAYATVGYAIYQFVKGMSDMDDPDGGRGNGGLRRDLDRALNEDNGRSMNMTGPGRGMNVSTEDSSGTSVSHLVGRGVVQQ
ncbi:MAG: hypothetical protein H7Z14_01135 [Anaerolineae bacterium]|nr:hypothetical protein [Phycisphaerae bacterium]